MTQVSWCPGKRQQDLEAAPAAVIPPKAEKGWEVLGLKELVALGEEAALMALSKGS